MLVAAAFLAASTGCPSLFALPPTPIHLWGSIAAALLVSAILIFGNALLMRVTWFKTMAGVLKRMLSHPDLLGPQLDTSRALPIAAFSSVGEEAFFRGFVQPWLILKLADLLERSPSDPLPVFTGVALASLIFGLIHFPVLKELRPWTLFAIVVGALFGLLAVLSGSLLAPILAHFLINWRNLCWLAKSKDVEATDLEGLFRGASTRTPS